MEEFIRVNSRMIEHNLSNLKQLVFEVTDACNLRCKYCGYGGFYEGYDQRENLKLSFQKARLVIDYLYGLWGKEKNANVASSVMVSFYGGEPLLNVPFIQQVIAYLESLSFVGKQFHYNMTTNAMLLDRYMDYLVEKEFRLLISLDGDKEGQSYRVDAAGNNSFDQVYRNILLLRERYPEFYKRFVRFNSVLHNRNSVESTFRFIKDNLGKEPHIAPLNNSGIRKDQVEEFYHTYRNISESIKQADDCESLENELFLNNPRVSSLVRYIQSDSGNVYRDYNSLLLNKETFVYPPTGTCIPFSKKMFVTVKGRILQCERINHEFALGQVTDERLELDLEEAADRFNDYIFRFEKQCKRCANQKECPQCVYQIDDLQNPATNCLSFCSSKQLAERKNNTLAYLKDHPELYKRILRTVIVR